MNTRVVEMTLVAAGLALMTSGIVAHRRAVEARAGNPATAGHAAESRTRFPSGTFAVVGARVFDGGAVLDGAVVLVRDGRIEGVGTALAVPSGVPVVRATGKTLLPGLIDAHTHAFPGTLERALAFGVTTELDMFTDHRFAASMKREQAAGNVAGRADLFSAGTLATAPGGHGTEFGISIPTLADAAEANAFVDARIAEGSDYVKIVVDDGSMYGYRFPTLGAGTVAALVEAAHRRSKLAVVHVATQRAAREALEAGADGLAHAFSDAAAEASFVTLAARRRAFVIPTLAVIAATAGEQRGRALASDERLAPYVDVSERSLDAAFPVGPQARTGPPSLAAAMETVRRLHSAGVPLLAGTDAPNPGTAHGVSLHHELALLVEAGLSPVDALAAATSVPARTFHLADRGRIAPGVRADLLLVEGDPTRDVAATRAIAAIWKGGVVVERRTSTPGVATQAPEIADGLLSVFEGDLSARFGSGWVISTDKMMGGQSEAAMRVVAGGAAGSVGSLEITGSIKADTGVPWAGAMVFLGPQPMSPANLSRFRAIDFWVRGDPGTYRLLVFAARLGNVPVQRPFAVTTEWRHVTVPFAALAVDGSDLAALLFSGSAGQSSFRLQLDEVRFTR